MKLRNACMVLAGLGILFTGFASTNYDKANAEGTYINVYSCSLLRDTIDAKGGYDSYANIDVEGISWRVHGYVGYKAGWRVGGKNLDDANREIFTKTPLNEAVTKIDVSTGTLSANTITVNSVTLNVYSTLTNNALSDLVESMNSSWAANSVISFENEGTNDWTNKYFEIVFNVDCGDSNVYANITGFDFYKTVSDEIVSLDKDNIELTKDKSTTITATSSGEVEWSVSPSDIVSIEASGELNEVATITGLKAGTATITATSGSASDTCTISVSELIDRFEKITSLGDINLGDIIAFVFEDTGNVITSVENNNMLSNSTLVNGMVDEYMPFQLVNGVTEGGYAFVAPNGQYLRNTASEASVTLNKNLNETTSWNLTFDGDVLTITNVASSKHIAWRATYNYARAYTYDYGDVYKAPSIYRYSNSSESEINGAQSFATAFLNALKAENVCDPNGVNTNLENLENVWSTYSAQYKALSEGSKAYIAQANANGNDDLSKLIEVYEIIVAKYSLNDFMFKNVRNSSTPSLFVNDTNNIIIISIIVLLVSAGICFLFYKKRKYN